MVLVPDGYHGPSMAAPGYDLYYLNVLAGPAGERSMAFCDDPRHAWIRSSWAGQDDRPATAASGGPHEARPWRRRWCASWPASTSSATASSSRSSPACFGIFGHGNVAGIGQALRQTARPTCRYYQCRNEQAMVHTAAAYAKMQQPAADARLHHLDRPRRDQHGHRRGRRDDQPPAGAAAARRHLRHPACRRRCCSSSKRASSQDISVNDCFKPVSRYWDRINRPEQLLDGAARGDARADHPAETGAVTLALPQDVQAEAFDYPDGAVRAARLARSPRPRPSAAALARAAPS